jgi:hypothetical protein
MDFKDRSRRNTSSGGMVSALRSVRRVRAFLFLPFFVAIIACDSNEQTRDVGVSGGDAGVREDSGAPDAGSMGDGGHPELVTCPTGQEQRFYSLSPLAQAPSAAELELSPLPPGAQVFSASSTGESLSARLDLCRDTNGTHTLRGVLWAFDEWGWPRYYRLDETISSSVEGGAEYRGGNVFELRLPPAQFIVRGLEEALSGNLQPLEIRLVHMAGLLILGHDTFVAGVHADVRSSSISSADLSVLAGGLTAGDVFSARVCPFGEVPHQQTFTMGTATFELTACKSLGEGITTAYRITSLAVTDTNDALTPAERATFTFDTDAEVEQVMNYVYNHHNACDSFHLALPHADYAASSAPSAGCGVPVPNAPMRMINEDPSGPVKYRIRYHQGDWIDGTIPGCSHYMFCD